MDKDKNIKQIHEEYKAAKEEMLPYFIEQYIKDGRPGVSKIISQAQRRLDKLQMERLRTEKLKEYEYKYDMYQYICGIDEVGRGPLAGRW